MSKIRKRPRKVKKLRFQFLAYWLVSQYEPCKVADIGGGKGLLSYILNKNGWESTVIDPFYQELPAKYRDLDKTRYRIGEEEKVKRITAAFSVEMAEEFDLLIGLHAHGCNMMVIDACKKYKKDFMILPCCVIDEPIIKIPGVNWRKSLELYAKNVGLDVKRLNFNFKGRSVLLYTDTYLTKKVESSFDDKFLQEDVDETLFLSEREDD